MRPPEQVKREFVHQWLGKASADLKVSKHLPGGDADLYYAVAFHAQQAAEKFLKAILVWHQVEFPKTHDISRLLDLIRTADAPLSDLLSAAAALTPYGVEVRYPTDLPEPTREQAHGSASFARLARRSGSSPSSPCSVPCRDSP